MIIIKGTSPRGLFDIAAIYIVKNMHHVVSELPDCVLDKINHIVKCQNYVHTIDNDKYVCTRWIENDKFLAYYMQPNDPFGYVDNKLKLFECNTLTYLNESNVGQFEKCKVRRDGMLLSYNSNMTNGPYIYGSTVLIHFGFGEYFFPIDPSSSFANHNKRFVKDFVDIYWKTEECSLEYFVVEDEDYMMIVEDLRAFVEKYCCNIFSYSSYHLWRYHAARSNVMQGNRVFDYLTRYIDYRQSMITSIVYIYRHSMLSCLVLLLLCFLIYFVKN